MNELKKLFEKIGEGKGSDIKTILTGSTVDTYKELFFAVLTAGDESLDDISFNNIWTGYVTQMGKMSRWVVNKSYVNDKLKPLVDNMSSAVGDGFEKGVNKGLGGTNQKDVMQAEPKKEEPKKAETLNQGDIQKIRAYPDKRLVSAFENMMANDAYPKKDAVAWFKHLIENFSKVKDYLVKYQRDNKFKSLYNILKNVPYHIGFQSELFGEEKNDADVSEFLLAVKFFMDFEKFLGQAAKGNRGKALYKYPTHNMLDRLKKCCDQSKREFGGVKKHPILKDVAAVYLDFIKDFSAELDKQLKEIPAKTEEQEREKLRKIKESYPEDQRYIPYKTPDKEYQKVFSSSAQLGLCWDRKEKMKVLLKGSSRSSVSSRKSLVEKVKAGKYKHIPKLDWFEDKDGNFVFVIEYVSGAIPIITYSLTLRNNRKALLNLCEQFLDAAEETNNLDCFPECKYEHFLVDKNGIVKCIDIDEGAGIQITEMEFIVRVLYCILKDVKSLKDDFLKRYNSHKNLSKSSALDLGGGDVLEGILGLQDMKGIIAEMAKS